MCKINNVYIYTISIHALLAESDIVFCAIVRIDSIFLSTLSLRRATWYSSASSWLRIYFYPRSPCGERRAWPAYRPAACRISIHALLAESDRTMPRIATINRHFYPRSPCGERRIAYEASKAGKHFYPRSPCGERHLYNVTNQTWLLFLSTLSLRRATLFQNNIFFHYNLFLSTLSLRRATELNSS